MVRGRKASCLGDGSNAEGKTGDVGDLDDQDEFR